MNKSIRIILIIISVVGLILVRQFAANLFYDPLIEFFKTDHTTHPLPEMMKGKLFINVSIRYVINSIISVLILWIIFRNGNIVRLSALIFGALFIMFMTAFVILVFTSEAGDHMALFYVRRFLIQPLFLLLLLPAFYFHKRS
jgi:exosortase F-associated protein